MSTPKRERLTDLQKPWRLDELTFTAPEGLWVYPVFAIHKTGKLFLGQQSVLIKDTELKEYRKLPKSKMFAALKQNPDNIIALIPKPVLIRPNVMAIGFVINSTYIKTAYEVDDDLPF